VCGGYEGVCCQAVALRDFPNDVHGSSLLLVDGLGGDDTKQGDSNCNGYAHEHLACCVKREQTDIALQNRQHCKDDGEPHRFGFEQLKRHDESFRGLNRF
jgi:hypothetical protein